MCFHNISCCEATDALTHNFLRLIHLSCCNLLFLVWPGNLYSKPLSRPQSATPVQHTCNSRGRYGDLRIHSCIVEGTFWVGDSSTCTFKGIRSPRRMRCNTARGRVGTASHPLIIWLARRLGENKADPPVITSAI